VVGPVISLQTKIEQQKQAVKADKTAVGISKTIPSELLRRGVREVRSVEGVNSILTMG